MRHCALLLAIGCWGFATAATAEPVSITSPADGSTVSGIINITIAVSTAYTTADIFFDGVIVGVARPDTDPPHTISLDTRQHTNGLHAILAHALFSDDNGTTSVGQDDITVTVENTVRIIAPTAGSTVSGTINITIDVSTAYTTADIFFDGVIVGVARPDSSPPHTITFDTTQRPNGPHPILAHALFSDDNGTTSVGQDDITITVNNTPPSFDKYGGRNDVACSGGIRNHFYREKIGNRWWLCTPQGHGFISISAYAVSWVGLDPVRVNQKYATGGPSANNDWKANWSYRMAQRYGGWGFNSYSDYSETGAAGQNLPYHKDAIAWPTGDHTIPIKMPYVMIHKSSSAAQRNRGATNSPPFGLGPAKGWRVGLKHVIDLDKYYPPYLDGVDYFDPRWKDYTYGSLEHEVEYRVQFTHPGVNHDWLLGVSFDDMDHLKFAGPGDAFPTILHGQPSFRPPVGLQVPHRGLLTLIASPVHTVDTAALNAQLAGYLPIYDDETFYAKKELIEWLQQGASNGPNYASIQALNSSWGLGSCGSGGYCSFASQAVAHAEALCPGEWDGVKTQCTQTLSSPPTPLTLRVKVGGVLKGGDDAYGYHPNPQGPLYSGGKFWGPGVSSGNDSVDYSTRAVSITFTTPPAPDSTPTIDYKAGGWGVGSGLADEDGTCPARGSQPCWMPAETWTLNGINANMKRDLDNFLQHYAAKAFREEREAVQQYIPGALLFCNSGGYAAPAFAPVLKAMGQHCDVALDTAAFSQAGSDDVDMLSRYNYFIANVGDMPIGSWEGFGVNEDSHLVDSFPSGDMKTSPPVPSSQEERAATYAAMLNAALNTRDLTYDSYHFVAWKWWALLDTPDEGYNWGLIDRLDNAYDGHEATTGTVACSPPMQTYTCGGDNGDWGNFLGAVTTANKMWLSLPSN